MIKYRILRWAEWKKIGVISKNLTDKPTGKRTLGSLRRGWEDYIRIYILKIDVNMRNWIDYAQDTDYGRARVNVALNLRLGMELVSWILYFFPPLKEFLLSCLITKCLLNVNISWLIMYRRKME